MIILIIIEIILFLIIVWVAVGFFNILFRGFAPLVISQKKVISLILDNIEPNSNQVIYELGSGSARFLQMVQKKFPKVKLVGLEYSIVPYLVSSIMLWLKNSSIKIRYQNMYKVNLAEADFIYCYLFPQMMLKLGQKVRSECKPGTILISYMFSVPNWEPKKIIKLDNGTIFFYEVFSV